MSIVTVLGLVVAAGCSATTHVGRPATAADLEGVLASWPADALVVTAAAPGGGEPVRGRPLTPTATRLELRELSSGQRLWIRNEDVQRVTYREGRSRAAEGVGLGLLVGVIGGALMGATLHSDRCGPPDGSGCIVGPEFGALLLGGVGGVIGAVGGGLVGSSMHRTVDHVFGVAPTAIDQRIRARVFDSPPE